MPIPGTRSRARLDENVASLEVQLTDDDLARIDELIPRGTAAGERYPEQAMAFVNG